MADKREEVKAYMKANPDVRARDVQSKFMCTYRFVAALKAEIKAERAAEKCRKQEPNLPAPEAPAPVNWLKVAWR